MTLKNIFGRKPILFTVQGKPPQKSQWGTKDAELIIKLREAALKARIDSGYKTHLKTNIKLNVTIYAPNVDDREYVQVTPDDPKLYIGDLDSLVAGICEYLHKGPKKGENKFQPSPLFDDKPEIRPEIPIIIDDDSRITKIMAKKVTKNQTYYNVKITLI